MKRRAVTLFGSFLVLVGIAAVQPQEPTGPTTRTQEKKQEEPSTEEQRRLIEEAKRFAGAVAKEGSLEHVRALEQSLLQLKLSRFGVPKGTPEGLRAAPDARPTFTDVWQRVREETANLSSIRNDETWRKNFRRWLELPTDQPLRIVGGSPAQPGEFPHCVAVGSDTGFCCSGTLIGPNVVLTAAHCVAGGCASRIYIGNNSNQPSTGRIVLVKRAEDGAPMALAHPQYDPFTFRNDVALLILEADVENVTPCQIGTTAEVDAAFYLRLSGFGYTNLVLRDFGVKNKVDVFVASNSCDSAQAQTRYGCNADLEIVAGGNGVDSCNGDSGGPAYVIVGNEAKLAGVTSRATRNSVLQCGDGGNYSRADRFICAGEPLYELAKAKGAKLP